MRNHLELTSGVRELGRGASLFDADAAALAADASRVTEGARTCERSPSGGGGGTSGSGGMERTGDAAGLLTERDLKTIEREHPDGVTSVQVVDLFRQREIRFSEATFRKYVQQGLVPRSRRIGRKGKHQGSLGLYPVTVIRRINAIKRLQAENYTIEDIQRQFLRFRDEIEELERGLSSVLGGFEEEIGKPHFDAHARRTLRKDIAEARKAADELCHRLAGIERRLAGPGDRPPPAPGGAEDLL